MPVPSNTITIILQHNGLSFTKIIASNMSRFHTWRGKKKTLFTSLCMLVS